MSDAGEAPVPGQALVLLLSHARILSLLARTKTNVLELGSASARESCVFRLVISPLGNMVPLSWCCVRSGTWCLQVGDEPAR